MRLGITARKFKLSEELRTFVEDEISRFNKYYDGIIDVDVVLGWEKNERYAEMKVVVFNKTLTATQETEDMHKSISLVADKIERQIVKYKDKLKKIDHEKLTVVPEESSDDDDYIEDED